MFKSFFLRLLPKTALHMRDGSGQIALSMALLALPLVIATGSALDYGMLVRARSGLQTALDSATLAAAAREGAMDPDVAKRYFQLNGSLEGVTILKTSFDKQSDGTVAGAVTATVPAVFMRILRRKDYTVKVSSTARGTFPVTITDVNVNLDSGQGTYDKDVYFLIRNASSGRIVKQAYAMYYDYYYDSTAKQWTAQWGMVPGFKPMSWGIGEYATLATVVYVDDVGLGRRVNPVILYMDARDSGSFVRATGDCTTTSGRKLYWEDMRDTRGDYMDLVMTVTCKQSKSGTVNVRITK